jgi:hypothetical protein
MEGLSDLEEYLRTARILDVSAPPGSGAHASFRVTLEGGVSTLAKPAHTAPEVGMVQREVAGWVVARELGWGELVATTVLRTTDVFPGHDDQVETSLQVLWPGFQWLPDVGTLPEEDVWKAAIFDVLVHQSDRGANNWGGVLCMGVLRLKLIDHGYAFSEGRGFGSTFEEAKRGQELPDELSDQVEAFLEGAETGPLSDFLETAALTKLVERGRHIVQEGTLSLS